MEFDLLDERDEVVQQGFVIDSLDKADWALRKKARALSEIERISIYADRLIQKINDRASEIMKPHFAISDAMDALLRPWSETEIAKARGKKSMKLISGTVGFRQSPGSLEVTDNDKAVAWMESKGHTECVRVKKEIKKAETKKLIESAGEIPEGMEMKSGEVRFYADPEPLELEEK